MSNTRYRCRECGTERKSEGRLHAHIDAKHTGFRRFDLFVNPLKMGDYDRLSDMTEVVEGERL